MCGVIDPILTGPVFLLEVFVIKHQHLLHLVQLPLKLLLFLQQLFDQLVLPLELLFEHFYYLIFAIQHVGQVPCQRGEAVVRLPLGFLFLDLHAAFIASVGSCALSLLML